MMEGRVRAAAMLLVVAVPSAMLGLSHAMYAHLSRAGVTPTFSPMHHPEAVPMVVVAGVSLLSLGALCVAAWRWLRLEDEVGELRGAAVVSEIAGQPVHIVEVPGVQMFTAGLRRPAIFATRDAVGVMTAPQIRAAVSHEGSHVANGDTRFRALYSGIRAGLGWFPGIRRGVSSAILLEERRADLAALESGSTPADLVGAIIAVHDGQFSHAPSLGSAHVSRRLSCLTSSGEEPASNAAGVFGSVALIAFAAPLLAHIPMICGL